MAIIIPSAKIYEKDNPKVRDNLITSIEVSSRLPKIEKNKDIFVSSAITVSEGIEKPSAPTEGEMETWDLTLSDNNAHLYQFKIVADLSEHQYNILMDIDKMGVYMVKTINNLLVKIPEAPPYNAEIEYALDINSNKKVYFSNYKNFDAGELVFGEPFGLKGTGDYLLDVYTDVYSIKRIGDSFVVEIIIQTWWKTGLGTIVSGRTYEFSVLNSFTLGLYYYDYINYNDNTVYIGDTNTIKPIAIEGNELMQTTNITNNGKELVRFGDYDIEHYMDIEQREPIYNEQTYGEDYDKWNYGASALVVIKPTYYNQLLNIRAYDGHNKYVVSEIQFIPTKEKHDISVDDGGYYIGKVEVCDIGANKLHFSETLTHYKNGKETATIRCSIADYYALSEVTEEFEPLSDANFSIINEPPYESSYAPSSYLIYKSKYYIQKILDYEASDEQGIAQGVVELIDNYTIKIYETQAGAYITSLRITMEIADVLDIAIDNSTQKMSFKIYDQVIPMVYGADGKDRPMSLKLDGSPKVFTVLGTKIFYDGAIFQEISLQEA